MKSEAEVKKRLREVKRKYLVQMLEDNLSAHHFNCVYNYEHKDKNGIAHICLLGANKPEEWTGTVCDGDDISMSCPYFEPKKTRANIKDDFDNAMNDPVILFTEYRDVAMLLWILGDSNYEDEELTLTPPWYIRMYRRVFSFLRFKGK